MAALLQDTRYVIRDMLFKLLLPFLLFTFYFLLFTFSPAFAQNALTASSSAAAAQAVSAPPLTTGSFPLTSPHYASLAIYNFSHALNCFLIGQSLTAPCLEFKLLQDAQGQFKSIPVLSQVNTSYGLVGTSVSLVETALSGPPLSSSVFLADFAEQLGAKPAHAQVSGSGSGVLSRIYDLWETSRNIAYVAMIIIFVIVGLMVMFRQKLNPQTVVTIQMALPGLVIGLVMITFSYFLASLIADMAFVGTNVVGYYFALAQGDDVLARPPLVKPNYDGEENILGIFGRYVNEFDSKTISSLISVVWWQLPGEVTTWMRIISGFMVGQITDSYAQVFSAFSGVGTGIRIGANVLSGLVSGLIVPEGTFGLIMSWIAWFVLLYSMFKLLFKLIGSLLTIIFMTIAAPFYFLVAALPGRQSLMTNWLFNMLCNVLVFPAVVAVLYFVAFMLGITNEPAFVVKATTQITNQTTFPLLGGIRLDLITKLLAFGALVALPSIPDVICRAVGKPSQMGGIIGGAVAGGIAAGQRYNTQSQGGVQALTGRAQGLADRPGWTRVMTEDDAKQLGRGTDWSGGTLKRGDVVSTYRAGFGATIGGGAKTVRAVRDLFNRRRTPTSPTAPEGGTPPTPDIPDRG